MTRLPPTPMIKDTAAQDRPVAPGRRRLPWGRLAAAGGIAIVRETVEAHGGRIGLANREGGGLAVSLVLPG